ncbi:MAG TPA: alkaline phosphatase family protein [Candidatus Cybelea sp.]|jgi:phospholipase C|nr:alkaline phosphatase family protein [Candidatus Cybelea sp.]
MLFRLRRRWFAAIAAVVLAACGSGSPGAMPAMPVANEQLKGTTPIDHVIVVVQENRSFDNLFATFPGADGTTTGKVAAVPASQQGPKCPIYQTGTVALTKGNLAVGDDFGHKYSDYQIDYDGGKMDGFDIDPIPAGGGHLACLHPYQYADPLQIAPYWTMAAQYVLADHMYQTQASGSFTAHQDLIAGGTAIDSSDSVIDNPSGFPWGCDSPPGTTVPLISTTLQYPVKGPFPCFTQYETMRDLLDKAHIPWKYYTQKVSGNSAGLWNGFDAISAVRNSKEWGHKVTTSDLQFFKDLKAGLLPSVCWITPNAVNSDHPQELQNNKDVDYGPSWVSSIVNSVGQSRFWKTSAIIVLWDDWGGFYDHEPPVFFDDQGGLGFRVPMLVISPYARETSGTPGYVSHTQYETASILKFVEENWKLTPMQLPDRRATSIGDSFDFTQKPRKFTVIPSEKPLRFFLDQEQSGRPPDTE